MRAMLLAAGWGTRLRPLTNTIPKCLVPIRGKPLLEIWLDRLTEAGIGPFLVNTHYLAEQVRQFVAAGRYNKAVSLVEEHVLLGTAGSLVANLDFFARRDGLLIHADNYCLADFRAFVRAHQLRPTGCVMTMMTFRTATPQSCGIVELDDRGVVVGLHEKAHDPPGNLANGAVYLLSAELLDEMSKELRGASDFSNQVLPHFLGRIHTHETREFFLDIGTPQAYALANAVRP